jgi:hypothetical protein
MTAMPNAISLGFIKCILNGCFVLGEVNAGGVCARTKAGGKDISGSFPTAGRNAPQHRIDGST